MQHIDIKLLSINTIRTLSIDAVQKANSGHPGLPLGCAPLIYHLFRNVMKHNPQNPNWLNRDRFILSAGHGSMLLYSILHLCGYDISLDDIKSFRQFNSKTPGHPEYNHTPGVETTTGPLGQGFANGIGMAIARDYLSAIFNKEGFEIFDHYIFCLCSDGDLMEGISHEAASFAGHQKISKLVYFYDDNGITIDGETNLTYSDDVEKRFKSYHWNVLRINDINNLDELSDIIERALKNSSAPTLVIVKSIIGFGSPNKQNKASSHGSPLGVEEVKLTKKNLGWNFEDNFYIPQEVKKHFEIILDKGIDLEYKWNDMLNKYRQIYPTEANLLDNLINDHLDDNWENNLPVFEESMATRQASGKVLEKLSESIPFLLGGSADLSESNNTFVKTAGIFNSSNRKGRNIHFGVREHAMIGILNGISLYSNLIPYGGTFLVFSDYLRPALRLAALMRLKIILVLTHDSIGLGEDGPTHQPIEHLSALRAIPNVVLIRPADANEVTEAWRYSIKHKKGPVLLVLTRQKVKTLNRVNLSHHSNLRYGAYILKESSKIDLIILATGSEVQLALDVAEELEKQSIFSRVISFPSWEIFEMQNEVYKKKLLPDNIKKRVVIEAGITQGWEKYIGSDGLALTINSFGASAPYDILFEKFGFIKSEIAKKILNYLSK